MESVSKSGMWDYERVRIQFRGIQSSFRIIDGLASCAD